MLKNYFKTALRNLIKSRLHSTINILGLSVGITSILIIFLIIKFEKSFDNYHNDKDLIYRVVTTVNEYGERNYDEGVPYPMPEAFRKDFAELDKLTLTDANTGIPVVSILDENGNKLKFKDNIKPLYAQPDYFEIFNYTWIQGNPKTALDGPKTIVISRTSAMKYFNSVDVVGRVLKLDGNFDFTITGVVEDPPSNSDFPFHMIISYNLGADKRGWENWTAKSSAVNCYVRLKPNADVSLLNEKMKEWHKTYYDEDEQADAEATRFSLQPLSDVHTDTRFDNYNDRSVSDEAMYALALIGLFLILTACINFINLNTVLIVKRSKEVGVRKVLGSNRMQLALQFLGETALITLVAIVVSIGLVEIAVLEIHQIIGYDLVFEPFRDPATIWFITGLFVFINVAAGIYPAFVLSSFQPITALKNKVSSNYGEKINLRRTLIVVQLFIAQALIICTFVVANQMDYFLNKSLGFDKEAVVEFEIPEIDKGQFQAIKTRFGQIPGVQNIAFSNTGTASDNIWGGPMSYNNGKELMEDNVHVKFIDSDYVNTYKLQLLAGTNIPPVDSIKRYLVNEAAVRSMGYDNPHDAIGEEIEVWGRVGPIMGVVRNFNTVSLHQEVSPVVMLAQVNYGMAAAKLSGQDYQKTIAEIQQVWEELFADYVFEYSYLDESIEGFYEQEHQASQTFQMFSFIAIFIGMIGLFGLVSFMATQRTKEVGIRKTLGASVSNIIMLFSKEFMILVVIGFALAAPVAWYAMQMWLSNFAYRIDIGVGTFLISIVVVLIIVFATVGFKSMQAAVANPVDALKDE